MRLTYTLVAASCLMAGEANADRGVRESLVFLEQGSAFMTVVQNAEMEPGQRGSNHTFTIPDQMNVAIQRVDGAMVLPPGQTPRMTMEVMEPGARTKRIPMKFTLAGREGRGVRFTFCETVSVPATPGTEFRFKVRRTGDPRDKAAVSSIRMYGAAAE